MNVILVGVFRYDLHILRFLDEIICTYTLFWGIMFKMHELKKKLLNNFAFVFVLSSGLAKTILHGTVQGGRRRGRQTRRWEDNIKEWTGLEWNIILRKTENREEWRKLVVKSTVVPQRSARLRDR